MEEVRSSVLMSLQATEKYLPLFSNHVLKGVETKDAQKTLLKKMRTTLPVPCIFATLKILQRVQSFMEIYSDAFDNEETPKLPSSNGHVDHTVKTMFRRWCKQLQKTVRQQQDWEDHEWNPYKVMAAHLKSVIEYNTKVFFGVSFYKEEDGGTSGDSD